MDITRKIVFHAGHMLKDDTSKCFHPHGHEYVLECTIRGEVKNEGAENGMVMNFGELKEIMMKEVHDRVDHQFIIEEEDHRFGQFYQAVYGEGCYVVQFSPTAENLVVHFFVLIERKLPKGIRITKLKLQETHQCWVEYTGEPKKEFHTV